RVEFGGAPEQIFRQTDVFLRSQGPDMRHCPHDVPPGVETLRRFASQPYVFGSVELRLNRGDYACCDLILQGEEIAEAAVVPLRPHLATSRGVVELRGDPQPFSGSAYAPLKS